MSETRHEWLERGSEAVLDASLDADALAANRANTTRVLDDMRAGIDKVNEAFSGLPLDTVELPEPVVPDPIASEVHPLPLISSAWDWTEQTLRLIASKRYADER